VKKQFSDPSLQNFSSLIAEWFTQRFGSPTHSQKLVWPHAFKQENLLLSSPTGTGKTLAAFLTAIDSLIRGVWKSGELSVLYISPLKALNRDVRINLEEPLNELRQLARDKRIDFPRIRIETRSGDTDSYRRRRMLDKPPEILITTPESLNILLATQRGRSVFSSLRCVIIDEIHALAGNKRGTQLISALERLAVLSQGRPEFQRIALSATLAEPEKIAAFAAGFNDDGTSRNIHVLQSLDLKALELRIDSIPSPLQESGERNDTPWKRLADRLKPELLGCGSSLIFVNSRRLAEKMAFLLNRDEEQPIAYAHHGSLSREIRGLVEERLKTGKLHCIVATNSLELGIDIGELDRIILVQTPLSLSSAVQKIGRAGHSVGGVSKGKIFCSHGRDLLSAVSLARGIERGIIERILPPKNCLDVLAQIITGEALAGLNNPEEIYTVLKRSYPYHTLSREDYYGVVEMLRGYYRGIRIRQLPKRIRLTEDGIEVLPSGRTALFSSGGTIPDRGYYTLKQTDTGTPIGELDEEFVWERRIGDVFAFGTQQWRITGITPRTVEVRHSSSASNSTTFYRAEPVYKEYDAQKITGEILEDYFSHRMLPSSMATRFNLSHEAAEDLAAWLAQLAIPGITPHARRIVAEYTRGVRGAESPYLLFIHTLWGGRCNAPLTLALEELLQEGDIPVSVSWDNDSILIVSPQPLKRGLLFRCEATEIIPLIETGLAKSGIFGARFREAAARSLMIAKEGYGQRTPLWLSRLRAKRLLASVADKPRFPLIQEASRECLDELFDIPLLISLLRAVKDGAIEYVEVDTSKPSPLCSGSFWEQINARIYSDDTPDSPVKSRGEWAARIAAGEVLRPRIDDRIVKEFTERLRRLAPGYRPESTADLEEVLRERQIIPAPELEDFVAGLEDPPLKNPPWELVGKSLVWAVQRERKTQLHPFLEQTDSMLYANTVNDTAEEAGFREIFLAWFYYEGPCYAEELLRCSPFNSTLVRELLEEEIAEGAGAVIGEGSLVHDYITQSATGPQIIHRESYELLLSFSRTRGKSSAGKTVPLSRYYELLALHQGVDSEQGIDEILAAMEGFALSPELWENAVFPRRVADYSRQKLDDILQDREIFWIGDRLKRASFFQRENADLIPSVPSDVQPLLPRAGGFTFWEIAERAGNSPQETVRRLWREVWDGRISCDSWSTLISAAKSGFRSPRMPDKDGGGRAAYSRWRSRLPLKGNWFSIPRAETERDEIEKLESSKDYRTHSL
jgi:ATP-dependent helicase Lhr and Lhr-like helicase